MLCICITVALNVDIMQLFYEVYLIDEGDPYM